MKGSVSFLLFFLVAIHSTSAYYTRSSALPWLRTSAPRDYWRPPNTHKQVSPWAGTAGASNWGGWWSTPDSDEKSSFYPWNFDRTTAFPGVPLLSPYPPGYPPISYGYTSSKQWMTKYWTPTYPHWMTPYPPTLRRSTGFPTGWQPTEDPFATHLSRWPRTTEEFQGQDFSTKMTACSDGLATSTETSQQRTKPDGDREGGIVRTTPVSMVDVTLDDMGITAESE